MILSRTRRTGGACGIATGGAAPHGTVLPTGATRDIGPKR